MTLTACLRRILKEKILQPAVSSGDMTLRDKQSGMEVKVFGLVHETLAIGLDQQIGELKGIEAGEWKKVCDYLLISVRGGKLCALFVELKKTLHDTDQPSGLEQLRRSLPLLNYLRSVCAIECELDTAELEVRYALVASRRSKALDKQPVRAYRQPLVVEHKGISLKFWGRISA